MTQLALPPPSSDDEDIIHKQGVILHIMREEFSASLISAREKFEDRLANWQFLAAILGGFLFFALVNLFSPRTITYCEHVMAVSEWTKDSHEDANEDELKAFEAKAFEALKPLVNDCLEMAKELSQ